MTRRPTYPTAKLLAERDAWATRFPCCWVCGAFDTMAFRQLQTHEIARRSKAPNKWADVRNYVRTCQRCHDEILDWIGVEWQLALKALHDPDNYDRQFVNQIRGEAANSVEQYEVDLRKTFWRVIHGDE